MKKDIEASKVANDLFVSLIRDRERYLKDLADHFNRLGPTLKSLDFEKSSEICAEMMLLLGAVIPLEHLLSDVQSFQEAYEDKEHKFN